MSTSRWQDGMIEGRQPVLGPALTHGFATSVAVWIAWFITHLPWLQLQERFSVAVLLAAWLIGAVAAGATVGRPRALKVAALSGLVTALVGLLLLGSKLAEVPATGDVSAGLKPSAPQIALGFVGLGVVIGAVGGLIGGAVSRRGDGGEPDWLARFALVACVAVAPLLFVGGLVTSTNSGMAVPDWPNTYGSNMFLYPLGPRARPDVYLEHSHRLFGTLVGLTILVLTVWTLIRERRPWVKSLALVALAMVVVQGVLGGGRVLADSALAGMVHGVLAQLTFGLVVSLAVVLSPSWKRAAADAGEVGEPGPLLRRLRFFSTGLLHATILQLIFGAAYRHFRDSHSLWTHLGFSLVVVILATGAGFMAGAVPGFQGGLGPIIRRLGRAVLAVVLVQFALGWVAFIAGGSEREAAGAPQALIRTAHQANGGLLLALATALFLWTRRLLSVR
jgi:cytochrome c oxidase assembly protein subunit 15